MYNVDKFFKLLLSNEPFKDNQDSQSLFQLLLLISIYQNYVLLNKENSANHQVFQDFFKVSHNDREKLREWLINVKHLIEVNNPLGKSNQTPDVLMVSAQPEYLSSSTCESCDVCSTDWCMTTTIYCWEHHFSCVTQLSEKAGDGEATQGKKALSSSCDVLLFAIKGIFDCVSCRDVERKNAKVEREFIYELWLWQHI